MRVSAFGRRVLIAVCFATSVSSQKPVESSNSGNSPANLNDSSSLPVSQMQVQLQKLERYSVKINPIKPNSIDLFLSLFRTQNQDSKGRISESHAKKILQRIIRDISQCTSDDEAIAKIRTSRVLTSDTLAEALVSLVFSTGLGIQYPIQVDSQGNIHGVDLQTLKAFNSKSRGKMNARQQPFETLVGTLESKLRTQASLFDS